MQTHIVPFLFIALLAVSGCQVDPPECTALLTCCAGLREPSASQCRDAYQVFRGEEHADLLCREASQAYRCITEMDAGAEFYPDAGFSLDVGAPRYDAGRDDTDAGPEFYPDAGPRLDVGAPRYDAGGHTDAGPEFYPDAGSR